MQTPTTRGSRTLWESLATSTPFRVYGGLLFLSQHMFLGYGFRNQDLLLGFGVWQPILSFRVSQPTSPFRALTRTRSCCRTAHLYEFVGLSPSVSEYRKSLDNAYPCFLPHFPSLALFVPFFPDSRFFAFSGPRPSFFRLLRALFPTRAVPDPGTAQLRAASPMQRESSNFSSKTRRLAELS